MRVGFQANNQDVSEFSIPLESSRRLPLSHFGTALLWFCVAFCFQTGPSSADVGPIFGDVDWVTDATVSKIDSNGRFEMDDGIELQYRLWGVLPTQGYVAYLKENVLGDRLLCIHAGHTEYTGRRPSPLKPLPNTMVCQRPGEHSPFPGGLAGELFDAGVAEPFCPEAFSFFSDCKTSIQ